VGDHYRALAKEEPEPIPEKESGALACKTLYTDLFNSILIPGRELALSVAEVDSDLFLHRALVSS
jgi:hypothetical protein